MKAAVPVAAPGLGGKGKGPSRNGRGYAVSVGAEGDGLTVEDGACGPTWRYVYRLERADWLAYEGRRRELTGWRFAATLAIPAAFGAAYGAAREAYPRLFPFAADGWVDTLILSAVALVAWYGLTTAALTFGTHRRARRHPLSATDTTLDVFHDHLAETTGGQVRVVAWEMVGDVEVARRHVFIYPAGGETVVVPERAFENHADMVAFGSWAEARCHEADKDSDVGE